MSENVIDVTDENFEQEVTQADQPVLVDFWAEWCMPCKMVAPTIEEVADEYADKVKVAKADTEQCRNTAVNLGIRAIPTVILFNKGEVVKKFVGVQPKTEFTGALDEVVG
ncbi:MAG: thioredoxin [Phycisphaerae bacterium]|nr:thioredoxin [Phycisphaerae bacterium]